MNTYWDFFLLLLSQRNRGCRNCHKLGGPWNWWGCCCHGCMSRWQDACMVLYQTSVHSCSWHFRKHCRSWTETESWRWEKLLFEVMNSLELASFCVWDLILFWNDLYCDFLVNRIILLNPFRLYLIFLLLFLPNIVFVNHPCHDFIPAQRHQIRSCSHGEDFTLGVYLNFTEKQLIVVYQPAINNGQLILKHIKTVYPPQVLKIISMIFELSVVLGQFLLKGDETSK